MKLDGRRWIQKGFGWKKMESEGICMEVGGIRRDMDVIRWN
jgi:hypothetical protein